MCNKRQVLPTYDAWQHRHEYLYTTNDLSLRGNRSLKRKKLEIRLVGWKTTRR